MDRSTCCGARAKFVEDSVTCLKCFQPCGIAVDDADLEEETVGEATDLTDEIKELRAAAKEKKQ